MASYELLKITYSALSDLAGGRVYDYVPETAAYPFVSLALPDSNDNSGDLYTASDCEIIVNIWGQQEGFIDIDAIAQAIYARLHYQYGLQSASHKVVYIYEQQRSLLHDPDGKTRRIRSRYLARLEKN